jgi:hypothetical protein
MPNPQIINIPEWEWVAIATDTITGNINRLEPKITYYYTYRIAGDPVPPAVIQNTIPEEAVKIFTKSETEILKSTSPDESLDFYVMCANSDDDDTDFGKIRVNI